jgi:heme A synthase
MRREVAPVKGVLLVAVACLAAGLFVIFYFCNGTTGLSFAWPLSGSSIHIDITTTGAGVPIAVALTLTGAFLLIVATIIALIGMFRRKTEDTPTKRRETAFEE